METDMDQWNRKEPRNNPHTCSQLIFNKVGKNTQQRKESLQQVVLGKLDTTCKSVKLEHTLTPYTKNLKKLKYKTWYH